MFDFDVCINTKYVIAQVVLKKIIPKVPAIFFGVNNNRA